MQTEEVGDKMEVEAEIGGDPDSKVHKVDCGCADCALLRASTSFKRIEEERVRAKLLAKGVFQSTAATKYYLIIKLNW